MSETAKKVTHLREVKQDRQKKIKQAIQADGWYNIITGMGTPRDKTTYNELIWQQTDRSTAESFYAADEMGGKVAKIIPNDGTREGVTWNMDKNADQETILKFIDSEFTRLNVWPTFSLAWLWARVFGGACVFISVNDGARSLSRPLDWSRVKSINTLTVFDRWELDVTSSDIISDIRDPNFGLPEFYTYQTANAAGSTDARMIRIHHSRMIRFDGVLLPKQLFEQNNYWHDSIYGALADAITNYSSNHENIANIIADFNQPVYRIEGLTEAIAQDEDELVVKKLQTVDLMRSVARAVVLDKEDEFENVSTNVTGGSDLIELTTQRLVAGSDIPHTRLLGNSPSGLGATGEAELINYYDSVKSEQKLKLTQPIDVITEGIFSQMGAPPKPDDLSYEFTPLFQQKQEAELKTRNLQAEVDKKYIETGVLNANEVADSRFGTGRYSYETVIEDNRDRISSFDLAAEKGTDPSPGKERNVTRQNAQQLDEDLDLL